MIEHFDQPDPHIRDLNAIGFNHVCFAVDNHTRAGGLDFHSRKLALLGEPGGE